MWAVPRASLTFFSFISCIIFLRISPNLLSFFFSFFKDVNVLTRTIIPTLMPLHDGMGGGGQIKILNKNVIERKSKRRRDRQREEENSA